MGPKDILAAISNPSDLLSAIGGAGEVLKKLQLDQPKALAELVERLKTSGFELVIDSKTANLTEVELSGQLLFHGFTIGSVKTTIHLGA